MAECIEKNYEYITMVVIWLLCLSGSIMHLHYSELRAY